MPGEWLLVVTPCESLFAVCPFDPFSHIPLCLFYVVISGISTVLQWLIQSRFLNGVQCTEESETEREVMRESSF